MAGLPIQCSFVYQVYQHVICSCLLFLFMHLPFALLSSSTLFNSYSRFQTLNSPPPSSSGSECLLLLLQVYVQILNL